MKLHITMPNGEVLEVNPSELVLKNNSDNTGLVLWVLPTPGAEHRQPFPLVSYAGAFLSTRISSEPSVPGLLAVQESR